MAKERHGSREEIAEILGCETRTITNYIKLYPDFPSRVRGKNRDFPIARCVAWKLDRMVADAISNFAPPAPSTLIDAEKRKAIADAELAELKVQKLRGEVVPIAESIKLVERAFTAIRSRLMSVPGEYAPQFLNLDSMPAAVIKLRELSATVIAELPAAVALLDDELDEEVTESGGADPTE